MMDDYFAQTNNSSSHSINSWTSIIKQIKEVGVEGASPSELCSFSSSIKRRKNRYEDDSACSGLKKEKT